MENNKKLLWEAIFIILVFWGTVYGVFHGKDFRMLSGNPRLFNCRDESAKRFSGEFEKQEDIECVFEIFLLFLYVYGILCV